MLAFQKSRISLNSLFCSIFSSNFLRKMSKLILRCWFFVYILYIFLIFLNRLFPEKSLVSFNFPLFSQHFLLKKNLLRRFDCLSYSTRLFKGNQKRKGELYEYSFLLFRFNQGFRVSKPLHLTR